MDNFTVKIIYNYYDDYTSIGISLNDQNPELLGIEISSPYPLAKHILDEFIDDIMPKIYSDLNNMGIVQKNNIKGLTNTYMWYVEPFSECKISKISSIISDIVSEWMYTLSKKHIKKREKLKSFSTKCGSVSVIRQVEIIRYGSYDVNYHVLNPYGSYLKCLIDIYRIDVDEALNILQTICKSISRIYGIKMYCIFDGQIILKCTVDSEITLKKVDSKLIDEFIKLAL